MSAAKAIHRLLDILLFAIINIWSVIESVVFVGGIFLCIMLPVAWPMKFIYMAIWLITTYLISKLVKKLDVYRKPNK